MKITSTLVTAAAFGAKGAHAFASLGRHALPRCGTCALRWPHSPTFASVTTFSAVRAPTEADKEAEGLRAAAARLREEAAELEREQAHERSRALRRAFDKFDTNGDGALSLEEVKAGLEKTFHLEVSEARARRLLEEYDTSGDGLLQPDEFVGIEQFRRRMDAMADEERRQKMEAAPAAQKEAEVARIIESQLELINDKEPSGTDRIASVLPYLLPLMDGLSYGKFFLSGHEGNPLVGALALLYTIYSNIPFGGFLAFFGLSFISGNLAVNRLVRFNAQQAIYLDIALFVPGLIAVLAGAASSGLGVAIPPAIVEVGNDAVFVALVAALGYSALSSMLGATPDKIPFLSEGVDKRVPSADDIQFIDPATGKPFFEINDQDENKDEGKE